MEKHLNTLNRIMKQATKLVIATTPLITALAGLVTATLTLWRTFHP